MRPGHGWRGGRGQSKRLLMTAHPFPIAILLASYQGARFIGTQLDSLAAQAFPHWRLVVSDDGSIDGTPDLVREFAARYPDREITLIPGPRQGATSNFLHLLAHLRDGEAMAFCDQDDLWLPDRLAVGVAALSADNAPASHARTEGDAVADADAAANAGAASDGARDADAITVAGAGSGATTNARGEVAAGASQDADAAQDEGASRRSTSGNSAPGRTSLETRAPDSCAPEGCFAECNAPQDDDSGCDASSGPTSLSPAVLSRAPARPMLHVTRTTICDEALSPLRPAPLYARPPGFLNALVQSCTPGNTMLVDPSGAALLRAAAPAALRAGVISHDWWSYMVISGAGGSVIRDPRQTVLYRQHRANVMGRNDTPRAMLARLTQLGGGDFGGWLAANIAALKAIAPMLTPENRARLADFSLALTRPGPAAAVALARLGVYRQTRTGTAALLGAAAAGRLRY